MRRVAPMEVYQHLHAHYGAQHWWPADTRFEIMTGAILTQNTRWENVEDAIRNLKQAKMLNPESIVSCDTDQLQSLIRPAGFFEQKSKYLVELSGFLLDHDGIDGLKRWATQCLRARLLDIHGIGPETADCILLYALDRPVFVVDAYTERIFNRLGILKTGMHYNDIQDFFFQRLPNSLQLFQEYHALIVEHAKAHCCSESRCDQCPLCKTCQAVCVADESKHF